MNDKKEIPQWRVLYTKPRAEKKAKDLLAEKGFVTYLPCTTVVKQWSDRKKKVLEPLFRSYLFIFSIESQLYEITREESIVGIVHFGEHLAVVREKEMDIIRKIEAGITDVAVVDHTIIEGQKVRIKTGPLTGTIGILTEFRGAQRVAIAIETLGSNLLINVAAGDITKVKEHEHS
ncbi:MAG: UpxY family transcription antiterminator [Bacteroidales bacterium]|jgi:transcription antitermination factor NusG|nr:UpxY family transcription antiterminator [Bacteroidales bacterium]